MDFERILKTHYFLFTSSSSLCDLPNSVFIYFSGCASKQFPIALWTIFKKRRRPVRSCWCLLFFDIYVHICNVHKTVKTKIIVPKTSFRLTENFLADAFAFLWSDRHASYVQEHVHHYSATGHPASLWEMFSFFDWDSQFGHMMTTISSKVIYPKYFRNSNGSCTFLLLGRFGHQGSLPLIAQSKCLKYKVQPKSKQRSAIYWSAIRRIFIHPSKFDNF